VPIPNMYGFLVAPAMCMVHLLTLIIYCLFTSLALFLTFRSCRGEKKELLKYIKEFLNLVNRAHVSRVSMGAHQVQSGFLIWPDGIPQANSSDGVQTACRAQSGRLMVLQFVRQKN
jgi:hypothetical protein